MPSSSPPPANTLRITNAPALKTWSTDSLSEAFGLEGTGELVSVVGGGGKSALLFGLGRTLSGRTLLTTTTRIFAAQTSRAAQSVAYGSSEYEAALRGTGNGLLVIGKIEGDKAKGVEREVPARLLAAPGVDTVVVEADGSRMLPAKAPAEHEPVLPAETTLLIAVAGIDALKGSIEQTCHRPERVSALLDVPISEALTPSDLARLLCHADGGLKGRPEAARAAIFLNKVEAAEDWGAARRVAHAALESGEVERVVLGALEPSTTSATSVSSTNAEVSADDGGAFEVFARG